MLVSRPEDPDAPDAGDLPDLPDGPPSGGGAEGTLVVDGETIELSGGFCTLEPQDAVAGGGQILFTGQASGVNGDGEEVMLDVTRFDEDSALEGDAIGVVVGDAGDPDARSYSTGQFGVLPDRKDDHLSLDGSTISANDVELIDDEMEEHPVVSFEINC